MAFDSFRRSQRNGVLREPDRREKISCFSLSSWNKLFTVFLDSKQPRRELLDRILQLLKKERRARGDRRRKDRRKSINLYNLLPIAVNERDVLSGAADEQGR